jgi:predicted CoA-binding protein
MFENPPHAEIEALLRRAKTIAVLGLSETLGEQAWPDLESALKNAGPVDIVDVFRRPEHVAGIVDDALRLGVKVLWLQEGVIDEAAAQKARDAGVFVVMDRCLFKERRALGG